MLTNSIHRREMVRECFGVSVGLFLFCFFVVVAVVILRQSLIIKPSLLGLESHFVDQVGL